MKLTSETPPFSLLDNRKQSSNPWLYSSRNHISCKVRHALWTGWISKCQSWSVHTWTAVMQKHTWQCILYLHLEGNTYSVSAAGVHISQHSSDLGKTHFSAHTSLHYVQPTSQIRLQHGHYSILLLKLHSFTLFIMHARVPIKVHHL